VQAANKVNPPGTRSIANKGHAAQADVVPVTQPGRKTAVQAASKVNPPGTRSIANKGHAAQADVVPVASGLRRKRAAPTCQYCHEQGHRNSDRWALLMPQM